MDPMGKKNKANSFQGLKNPVENTLKQELFPVQWYTRTHFQLHPRKLTWNLKMKPWKRRFLLKTIVSRFRVSFRGVTAESISNRARVLSPMATYPCLIGHDGTLLKCSGFLLFSEKWSSLYGTPKKNNNKTKDQNTKCKSLKGRTKLCLVLKLENETMFVYHVSFETKKHSDIFFGYLYVYIFTQNETTSPSCEISPTHSLRNNKTSDVFQKLFASIPFQALLPPTVINFWMKPGEQRWNKGQLRYLAGRTKEVIKKPWKRSRETGSPTNSFNLAQGKSSKNHLKPLIFGFQC